MNSKLSLVGLAASIVLATPVLAADLPASKVHPGFVAGNALWAWCGLTSTGTPPPGCVAYVEGVLDGEGDTRFLLHADNVVCFGNVPSWTVTDAVRRYIEQHPEKRSYAASSLVIEAVGAAFPCPTTPQ